MDNLGQATADEAINKLDLRRVLFELLVLCGMDREIGSTGKVDAQGRPDAVSEAQYYLYGRIGRPKPVRAARPDRYKSLWYILETIAYNTAIVLYLWWVNLKFVHASLWILVVVCVVLVCSSFIPRIKEFQVNLENDELYRIWLILLADGISRNYKLVVTLSGVPLNRGLSRIRSGSSREVMQRITDYRVLCPDIWRKSMIKVWIPISVEFLIRLIVTIVIIAGMSFAASRLNWWWFFALAVVLNIVITAQSQRTKASPPVLRTYLVKHLLDQLQAEATGASGSAATKVSPCRSAALS